ncbi:NADH-quinone oxidoreductase subunit C [Longispora albida]|uniref:NADH-quinone oxidoreductase subunit C n=1 Tax=Longispora albida TaxID=203523 RepID=UPI00036A09F8|nr:NADH-quinone oxidoreductase subunit C [Longispora albida]
MTAEEFAARFGGEASESAGGPWSRPVADVPAERWAEAMAAAKADGLTYFDWLSAVDELDDGFRVVVHLWSVPEKRGLLIRTLVPRDNPAVASIVGVFPGAAWHERETHEMFGVDFPGNANLARLLLPEEFEGTPLRKEFVLASRVAKPWPGAKEPGEGAEGSAKRAPMRPPGVPTPEEWGPRR